MGRFSTRVVLIAMVLGVFAHVSPVDAADKWLSVQSKNFLLVGNASEAQIKRVARNLEQFREAFATVFPGVTEHSSVGTTVVVFKDDPAFRPYKPVYEGKPANISGYFQPGSDVNFIALTGDLETPRVIYHEFVHSLTADSTRRLPPWASEGLAEFYSTFEVSANDKELTLGRVIGDHVLTLKGHRPMPVPALLAVTHDSPEYNEKTKQGIFYAQSWSLVHYLLAGGGGANREKFSKYLNLVSGGKSIDDSFSEAFQMDYSKLETELFLYIGNRLTWPAFRVKLENKLDFDKESQVATLSEAQAHYYLGDLMMHMNRMDAAEKELQTAISLDAAFAPSYASMGMMRMRQKEYKEALSFLSRAAESDSQNYMAHYYYASLLQRLAEDEGPDARKERLLTMRTHLKKSIELAPYYVEAYSYLGYVAASLNDELEETEALLSKAIRLAPGREDLKLSVAQLLILERKTAAARSVITAVRNATTDDAIRSRANTMLDNVEARLAYEQAQREKEQSRAAQAREVLTTPPTPTVDNGPPRLTKSESSSAPATEVEVNADALNNKPKPAGPQVEGLLTMMDCAHGLTIELRVDNAMVRLHSDAPSKIQFTSFVADVSNAISCGPVKPARLVTVTYRRGVDPAFLGEPLVVEFRK